MESTSMDEIIREGFRYSLLKYVKISTKLKNNINTRDQLNKIRMI